jgi:hypothetical protein
MATDPRVEETKGLIKEAKEALKNLPDEAIDAAPEEAQQQVARLKEVVTYAEQVVKQSKPELVPKQAWDQVNTQLTNLKDQAAADPNAVVTGQAEGLASNILKFLAQFPVAQGKAEAKAVAELIAEVEGGADEQLKALRERLAEVGERGNEIQAEIGQRSTELTKAIDARKQELEQAISEVQTSLADERQRIEQTTTEQAETFRENQEERAQQFTTAQEQHETQIKEIEAKTNERTEGLIQEVETMRDKSAELVGAIGVTGTAERYKDEADEQKRSANNWRWMTVLVAIGAAGVALLAAHGGTGNPGTFGGRLAISAALGALAAYAAKQSSRHRDREEDAKATQLDLAAFQVFIEDLPEGEQAKERADLGRRLFGQRFAAARRKGSDQGPTLVNQIADEVMNRIRDQGGVPPAE